jgi:DNA-binding SARP family transcriptional activator
MDEPTRGLRDRSRLGVRLLGGFDLLLNGRPLQLPQGARRVVAFLALHSLPVQRLYVASRLWPDSTEDHAYGSLRTALWRLRVHGFVVATANSKQLALAPSVEVDVHDAAARARRAIRDAQAPDPNDLAQLCDAGEMLPDWYEDWVLLERERFHQLRLHALESLCERCARDGQFGLAAEAGLAAVAGDPLRESAHRAVIESYIAEDNVADALRQYRLYRELAREQLGIDPSLQMRELIQGLPSDDSGLGL